MIHLRMRIRRQHNKGSGGVEKAGEGAVFGRTTMRRFSHRFVVGVPAAPPQNGPLPAETRFCSGLCAAACNKVVAAQTPSRV